MGTMVLIGICLVVTIGSMIWIDIKGKEENLTRYNEKQKTIIGGIGMSIIALSISDLSLDMIIYCVCFGIVSTSCIVFIIFSIRKKRN